MGNEAMIWEGHPTWRAMLSFHIKWFIVTLVLFVMLLLVRSIGLDLVVRADRGRSSLPASR